MSDPTPVPLDGSELDLPAGATRTGAVDDDEPAEVTCVLRAGEGGEHGSAAARFGPRLEDVHAVLGWAAHSELVLEDVSPLARTITLSAPVGRWRELFGVELARCSWQGVAFRGQSGGLTVPADIAPALRGAFGLDTRPVAQHAPLTPTAESATVSPMQLRTAYRLPPGYDGYGQAIGVISLGGRVDRSDVILGALRFGLPAPELSVVAVRSAPPAPAPTVARPNEAEDQALALDVQVPATLATGARLIVYAAPNTAQGLVEAVATALADGERRPSVLLLNWSSGEQDGLLSPSLARSLDAMFAIAAGLGITVVTSTSLPSGPRGRGRRPRAPFPAVSPHVLACADTELIVGAQGVESQASWRPRGAARAAGPSALFEVPAWQRKALTQAAGRPGRRRVPDVCAHGAGHLVTVGGVALSLSGGGSGAAVWAGTAALLGQRLGRRPGLLAPLLYNAAPNGWDSDCGLGPPDAGALLRALATPT